MECERKLERDGEEERERRLRKEVYRKGREGWRGGRRNRTNE